MGKRRTRSKHHNHNYIGLPSSSEDMPCSSGTKLLTKEPSLNLDAGMGVGDSSVKIHHHNSSAARRHYNLGRSTFLKRSRRYYDQHYQWQNFGNHSNLSTSRGKISPLHDERLSFKFTESNSESGRQADGRHQAFSRTERIRSSLLVMDAVSPDKVKMICGMCQKHLRRNPYFLGNTMASAEFSIVAVLVCGHAYHADCLEQRTSFENRCDPPCPLCSGSPSQV
ncbi:monogalactosyldiacylglycerol synthase 2 [Hibiscus syriacus]|uniref:Monogalactosyldiacylglycerol synthase 2 n=1 Tax=Hibiscus syriacus TaxID=106335 RepID=A0A6A3BAG5_HIBSY|nr:uncharacterized protein LOC120218990 isoform X2 [Hibiscus syriacus]KAE8713944.1 monogalactosyldiacylglycerol synthase 2 [Hibiscus syriacus]